MPEVKLSRQMEAYRKSYGWTEQRMQSELEQYWIREHSLGDPTKRERTTIVTQRGDTHYHQTIHHHGDVLSNIKVSMFNGWRLFVRFAFPAGDESDLNRALFFMAIGSALTLGYILTFA